MAETTGNDESNQWQVDKSIVECNDYMFTHQVACDVCFHLRHPEHPAEDVSAHKYVLISRSPVFYAMLCGDWRTDDIDIVDIEPSTFKMMLRFLYTDQINIDAEQVFALMYAAKKYMIQKLIACCSKFLSEDVNTDTVCVILSQSLMFDARDLQVTAMHYIEENTAEVAESADFLNLTYDALLLVTKSNELSIQEVGLINAVFGWVENQCSTKQLAVTKDNKRDMLGEILNELRFHYLSAEELPVYVSSSDVMNDADVARVFRQMFPATETVSQVDVKNARKGGVYWVKGTDGNHTAQPQTLQLRYLTQVHCDKHIEIYGLKFSRLNSGYVVINSNELEISILDKSNVCLKNGAVKATDVGDGWTIAVALPEPVRVTDDIFTIDVTYKPNVNPNPNQYHYQNPYNISFQNPMKNVKCKGVSFEFKTSPTVLIEIQFKRAYSVR